MWKEIFSGASLLNLPLIVMLAFFGLFTVMLVWTHRRRGGVHYDRMSHLPLDLMPRDVGAAEQRND